MNAMALMEKLKSGGTLFDRSVTQIGERLAAAGVVPPVRDPRSTTAPIDPMALSLRGGVGTLSLEQGRYAVVNDCWEMFLNDERVNAGHCALGELSAAPDNKGQSFRLGLKKQNDDVLEALNDFVDREHVDLRTGAADLGTFTALEGDRFYQIVADTKGTDGVLEHRLLPGPHEGYLMKRMQDRQTGILMGWGLFDYSRMSLVQIYAPWEIVHYCFRKAFRFGLPLMGCGRLNWQRLRETETDLYLTRKARSGMKNVFLNEDWSDDEVDSAQRAADARERKTPRGPLSDVYMNAKSLVTIDPKNAQLSNVADVEYSERKLFTGLRIPKGLLSEGQKVNRATLEMQFQWTLPLMNRLNVVVSRGYRQVIRTHQVLIGQNPDEYLVGFNWADKDPTQPKERAESLAIYKSAFGLSDETGLERGGFSPAEEDEKNETALQRDQKLQKKYGDPHAGFGIRELVEKVAKLEAGLGMAGKSGDDDNGDGGTGEEALVARVAEGEAVGSWPER